MKAKILATLTLVTMLPALYMIFLYAPREALQGDAQRIFYMHLPIAIAGYVSAFLLFVGVIGFFRTGDLKWDRFGETAAALGVTFVTGQLITGSLWSRPIWGPWWVWDARTTLQVVLDLIFIGYFMLREFLPDRQKKAKLSAVFGLLGMIDVPMNYLSIYLVRTQHPKPVVSPGGGGQPFEMNVTLAVSFVAFGLLYAYLFNRRLAIGAVEDEVDYLEQVVLAHE